jgi:hypothetical protein
LALQPFGEKAECVVLVMVANGKIISRCNNRLGDYKTCNLLKDATSKHGLGDSKPNRFDKLTHAILASFQREPDDGHHKPLKRHLELHYTETTLWEDLFGKQQQPRDWSLETLLSLTSLAK